jgi:hypothetical protein
MTTRPQRGDAADYYFTYIDLVPDGDIVGLLDTQGRDAVAALRAIPAARALYRYAPGKWSIKDVVNHLSDCERLFMARAFWFARGFDSALPSFDQEVAVAAARADDRPWPELVDELAAIRSSTTPFFRALPADGWGRKGTASGNPFTVAALAFMCVGHVTHHMTILRERY